MTGGLLLTELNPDRVFAVWFETRGIAALLTMRVPGLPQSA
jgi:hypothetical protein